MDIMGDFLPYSHFMKRVTTFFLKKINFLPLNRVCSFCSPHSQRQDARVKYIVDTVVSDVKGDTSWHKDLTLCHVILATMTRVTQWSWATWTRRYVCYTCQWCQTLQTHGRCDSRWSHNTGSVSHDQVQCGNISGSNQVSTLSLKNQIIILPNHLRSSKKFLSSSSNGWKCWWFFIIPYHQTLIWKVDIFYHLPTTRLQLSQVELQWCPHLCGTGNECHHTPTDHSRDTGDLYSRSRGNNLRNFRPW